MSAPHLKSVPSSNPPPSESERAPQTRPSPSSDSPSPTTDSSQPAPQSSDADVEAPRVGLVKHREFNHQIIVIGRKGCGKSEWAIGKLLEFARTPCYVVAHDLGWKIPDTLHDGRATHVIRVSSADEAREGMKAGRHGIYAVSSENALEVLQLAKDIAAASLEANGGDKGIPCFFYCDEVVSAGLMDPNYIDPEFKRSMAEARHLHIGIMAGVQSARMLHNTTLTLCTHAQLFQITDAEDHRRLIRIGISKENAARTARLRPHESFGVKL